MSMTFAQLCGDFVVPEPQSYAVELQGLSGGFRDCVASAGRYTPGEGGIPLSSGNHRLGGGREHHGIE